MCRKQCIVEKSINTVAFHSVARVCRTESTGRGMESLLHQLRKSLDNMYSHVMLTLRANCRLPECTGHESYCRVGTAETQEVQSRSSYSTITSLTTFWCIVVVILAVASSSVRAMEDPITSQTVTVPPFNPHECRAAFDTSDQWIFVCGKHPDLYPILKFAEQVAKEECERTFSDQKWKCNGFSLLRAPNITKEANREAAYVNTLRFAVIAHTVAKACRELGEDGLLHSCSCDEPTVQTGGDTTVTCSDDVDFGLQFADKLLRLGIGSTNRKEFLDVHNFRVGQLVIRKLMDSSEMTCICSGVSGSCTVQTCWNQLPDFSVIGSRIKQLYDDACLVESNGKNGLQFAWISRCDRATTELDLLYNSVSPDFCRRDSYFGVVGVSDRECDPHSDGPNSCANLCGACDRRTVENHQVIEHQCACTFHFCCEIRCDTCNTERTYYTCS